MSQSFPWFLSMISAPDPADAWTPLGETHNTRYYLAAPDIAIIIPETGLKDDGASARVNIDFQTKWATSHSARCAVVVYMSNMLSQDSEARRIYAEGMDPRVFYAAALVVTSPISRAIGSFFIGLTKPGVPTRIFGTIPDAVAWCESQRGPEKSV